MIDLWQRALEDLQTRLSEENFETWLAPVHFDSVEDDTLVLRIPNKFFADWITSHYLELIFESIKANANDQSTPSKVRWELDESLRERVQSVRQSAPPPPPVRPSEQARNGAEVLPPDLNPKYKFNNFVVGPANQLAHAASVAVGSDPGRRYNPLFIYGGVGLGKTHLVNAIGHTILERNTGIRILYVSAERFTNEFIWSLQNHKIDEFRKRYRVDCDVLLMDDIQFLAGREQTQEEFFHTFNALHHSDRQIVVTSDVYPQQIQEMEERLISRFQSGMVADVQAPELDTRIAILQKKAETEEIALSSDVALFLAQVVKSNVRELEGTLLRIAVKAELLGRPIDLELAKETMRSVLPPADSATSVEDIQRAVCGYFGIRMADLKGKKRHRAVSFPRMVAMYLCRQRLGTSYPELGDRFGGKDHTTVISACRKISGLVEDNDERVVGAMHAIERKLGY
ncbi:MAG: chromosomal replication initiator protein DnaA [Polyangiales bacterium]